MRVNTLPTILIGLVRANVIKTVTSVFTLAIISIVLVPGCGDRKRQEREFKPSTPITLEQRQEVEVRVEQIQQWAPRCDAEGVEPFPSAEPCEGTGDGDSTAHSGLLCLSGHLEGCEAVKKMQDEDGRMWRSPRRVGNPQNYDNTYSRDMWLGHMMYLVVTKDTESATRWLSWLEQQEDWKMCPDATDTRCNLNPHNWGLMARVWRHIGLLPTERMANNEDVLETTISVSSKFAPLGYQLELVAEQLHLNFVMGHKSQKLKDAAKWVSMRQVDNPYFRWLADEGKATKRSAELFLSQAPATRPAKPYRWTIAKDTAGAEWDESSGWDYVFLGRLILGGGF